MKNKKDPTWISQADRIYGGLLYLFPSAHRKEFGPWMRQAFRDRCREVARGEQSLFRVLAGEIVPDLMLGAGREHMTNNFGELQRKHIAAITLLGCMSLWAIFDESVNRQLIDLVDIGAKKVDAIKWQYRAHQHENDVEGLATWLVKKDGSPKAKALAANLLRFIEPSHSNTLVGEVSSEHADLKTLAIAELACDKESGCDRSGLVRRLTEQDSENAYVWLRALGVASASGDKIGERFAIKGLASATHYENYQSMLELDLFDLIRRYSPNDKPLTDSIDSIVQNQYPSGFYLVRSPCFTQPVVSMEPELSYDCRQAAMALSRTDDLLTASISNRLLFRLSTDDTERARAYEGLRDQSWWKGAYYSVGVSEDSEAWANWREKWRGKRESISAIKTSLALRGMPTEAPSDYEIPGNEKALLLAR